MSKKHHALALVVPLAAMLASPGPAGAEQSPAEEEEGPLAPVIGADKSPAPKAAEWAKAPRVKPTRRGESAIGCRVYLLREWARVRCPGEVFALSLLGGEIGVSFWIDPATKDGEVLFPLRPGSRHVVELWRPGKDDKGDFALQAGVILQAYWLEGEAAPVLTLY